MKKRKFSKNQTDNELDYEDVIDMFDEDELAQLEKSHTTKRKIDEESRPQTKKVRYLLPVKSSEGIIPRFVVDEENESDLELEGNETEEFNEPEPNEENIQQLTTVQILIKRIKLLNDYKVKIGTLCSDLLEIPEEKVFNFKKLYDMYDKCEPEVFLTVRKLVLTSLLEVFKDILPSYAIKRHEISKEEKLKKQTIQLYRYENLLLQYYQKYLQRLEKLVNFLAKNKKKEFSSVFEKEKSLLAHLAVKCCCSLLKSNLYFNYSENIIEKIIPFLQNSNTEIRALVFETLKKVFEIDKRAEMSLKIVQRINKIIKKKTVNIRVELVDLLNYLPINDVNLEAEKQHELKVKKLETNRKRIINLSKKEKKKHKKIKDVEKELLETKAEENKEQKQKHLTEITTLVFLIYLRVLGNVSNSKVLFATLTGLSKFAPCINMEFYSDVVTIIMNLINNPDEYTWLKKKDKVACIRTVFSLLSGKEDLFNVDPSNCYVLLYNLLLDLNCGKNHRPLAEILIETLSGALIKRSKKVSKQRLLGFIKRLATVCLQNNHNTTLAILAIIRQLLNSNSSTDVLLDLDKSVGQGNFQPELNDPEYCNASNTALWELILLKRSYHPIVKSFANLPANESNTLPVDLSNKTPKELFKEFDTKLMQFNPKIEEPKVVVHKKRIKNWYGIKDIDFCNEIVSKSHQVSS